MKTTTRSQPNSGITGILCILEVHCRDTERNYFQTRSTTDLVNQTANDSGWTPPDAPPKAPGKSIPDDGEFNDGHVNDVDSAGNGEADKQYVWRWDKTANRYCAVGESTGSDNSFRMYDESEYAQKTSGSGALIKQGGDVTAPAEDPSQPKPSTRRQATSSSRPSPTREARTAVTNKAAIPSFGPTGTPATRSASARNEKDGETQKYYFDNSQMQQFNNVVKAGDKNVFVAKDSKDLPGGSSNPAYDPNQYPFKHDPF